MAEAPIDESSAEASPAGLRWTAIAAMASNRVIGRDGKLPWHLPEDFRWFKKTTLGHPVVMGRATWESLGKPLPGRRNVVVSASLNPVPDGVERVRHLTELDAVGLEGEVFVIGGALLYEALLPRCQRLYLSYVFAEYEGDAWFPPFEGDFEQEGILERHEAFEVRSYRRRT